MGSTGPVAAPADVRIEILQFLAHQDGRPQHQMLRRLDRKPKRLVSDLAQRAVQRRLLRAAAVGEPFRIQER
jgi:hypothetical protein